MECNQTIGTESVSRKKGVPALPNLGEPESVSTGTKRSRSVMEILPAVSREYQFAEEVPFQSKNGKYTVPVGIS
jgi:hypothetical protein